MAEKINVECKSCETVFNVESDEVDQLVCPECEGPLEVADESVVEEESVPEAIADESSPKTAGASAITLDEGDTEGLKKLADAYTRITGELEKVIIGQKSVIEEILVAILAGGALPA